VLLRHPELRDYAPWSDLRNRSRAHLTPWEPSWPEDELTRASFRHKLRRHAEDIRDGRSYPFFIFRLSDEALLGGLTLSRVQRGVSHSASLGYWIGAPFVRRGYTLAAVKAALAFGFEDLNLHRLEAACQPDNAASQALLLKAGFTEEGRAASYLKINGAWRDHLLFGIVNPADAG
jgi:ribosomal-protein-alanine N-acetyltransferase